MSLQKRILIPVMLCLMISISSIALILVRMAERYLIDDMVNTQHDLVVQVEQNFSGLVEKAVDIISTLNYNSTLYKLVREENTYDQSTLNTQTKIRQIIEDARLFSPKQDFKVVLYDWHGNIYQSRNFAAFDAPVNMTVKDEPLAAVVREKSQDIIWLGTPYSLYGTLIRENVVQAVKKLNYNYPPDGVGLLVVELSEQNLYNLYRGSLSRGNSIWLVDKDGKIISSSDRDAVGSISTFWRPEFAVSDSLARHYEMPVNDQHSVVTIKRNVNTGWYVMDVLSYEAMSAQTRAIARTAGILIALCLLVCIPAIWLALRMVIKPIRTLCGHMRSAGPQLEAIPLPGRPTGEIKNLYAGYNTMLQELKGRQEELLTQQAQRRKAELQALQAQINPHFLYNTLSSVRFLIADGQNNDAQRTLTALSRLLRSVLGKTDEMIPLQQEVVLLHDYFAIINIRYAEKAMLHVNVPAACQGAALPRLLLQPIVENALLHGLSSQKTGGSVSLYASRIQDRLRIEIMDNGTGMEPTRVDELNRYLGGDKSIELTRMGLANVRERLRYAMGEDTEMRITSVVDVGTSIVLLMPFMELGDQV